MFFIKERLYEENLTLKSILNTLKKENLQLKTKLTSLDRENYKYEKIIYDTDYLNNKKGVKTQYYLSNEVLIILIKIYFSIIICISSQIQQYIALKNS